MIRTPGELYRFTGFDVPARGADPAFQLDALQRRVDQECREKTAALAREHNDANVMSVGARMHTTAEALSFVEAFLSTPFSDGTRHVRRIGLLADYEAQR